MEKIDLQITSGHGPRECAYVVSRVLDVLIQEAQQREIRAQVRAEEVSHGPGPHALLSASIELSGIMVREFAANWLGTIQWIGQSPYRPDHRRKNWFIAITEVARASHGEKGKGKVRVQMIKASGPGGQNVNKRNTAVRVTDEVTGVSVVAREMRSQLQNRKLADAKLRMHRELSGTSQRKVEEAEKWTNHQNLVRGGARRVFRGEGFIEA